MKMVHKQAAACHRTSSLVLVGFISSLSLMHHLSEHMCFLSLHGVPHFSLCLHKRLVGFFIFAGFLPLMEDEFIQEM